MDASDGSVAAAMGLNTSQKLANAANTAGVEKVSINPDGTIVFPATVNFNPTPPFTLKPGPTGFPPAAASPPAVGDPGYSPLIQMPDGVVLNAPQIANNTGQPTRSSASTLHSLSVTIAVWEDACCGSGRARRPGRPSGPRRLTGNRPGTPGVVFFVFSGHH